MSLPLLVSFARSWVLLVLLLCACAKTKVAEQKSKPYQEPLATFYEVNTLFSDSAIVKVQLQAPSQEEYANGDRKFPKGLVLYFFDLDKDTSSSLRARYAVYSAASTVYTVRDSVVIQNEKEGKRMDTEELHWNPTTKKVYTEKFVKITTPEERLEGMGLDALQDFSYYRILRPTGVFSVKPKQDSL